MLKKHDALLNAEKIILDRIYFFVCFRSVAFNCSNVYEIVIRNDMNELGKNERLIG